jgi:hypothetical protein
MSESGDGTGPDKDGDWDEVPFVKSERWSADDPEQILLSVV